MHRFEEEIGTTALLRFAVRVGLNRIGHKRGGTYVTTSFVTDFTAL